MSLLSVLEAIKWTPALNTINRDLLCNSIEVVERNLFLDCLSLEFRDLLIESKNDFSNVQMYSDANTYAQNDLVEINNIVYKSKTDNNTNPISDNAHWELMPAFNDELKERLWNVGMAKWIAMSVYSENLAYITYHAGGKGIVKHFEDSGQRTIEHREFYSYKRQVDGDIKMAHRVMMDFIKRNAEALGFEQKNCEDENCFEQSSDRIAW